MASTLINCATVNYLRYAALGLGVYYSSSKNIPLTHFVKVRHDNEQKREYDLLVEEALIAYTSWKDSNFANANPGNE
ncbi:hypothetical protein HDU93_003711 [Gonapodya sp. JEL0774]|nr:hypothetical protein HDU93_003711 [Gonapodya sp. JEL0774]